MVLIIFIISGFTRGVESYLALIVPRYVNSTIGQIWFLPTFNNQPVEESSVERADSVAGGIDGRGGDNEEGEMLRMTKRASLPGSGITTATSDHQP